MTGFSEQLEMTNEKYLAHFAKVAEGLQAICGELQIPLDASGVNAVAFTTYKATKDALGHMPTGAATPVPQKAAADVPSCPICNGKMWDNRENKKNPKAPDFKCRDKSCEGVIWPPKKGAPPKKANDFNAPPASIGGDDLGF